MIMTGAGPPLARLAAVCLCLACLLLWLQPRAFAQEAGADEEFEVVEPIITEETLPNPPGDWDLRMSGGYFSGPDEPFGYLPRTQLFFGIAKRWGGDVSLPFNFVNGAERHYGLGDASATLKFLARPFRPGKTAVVLGVETGFPTGDSAKELGEGAYEVEPFLALLHVWDHVTLQGNLGPGITQDQETGEREVNFFYNAAAAFPFRGRKWHVLAEVNGCHQEYSSPVSLAPGIKYSFQPGRFLGVSLPVGLNSSAPRLGVVVQFQTTLNFGGEKERR